MDGSVNNFALHLSLETPLDGEDADSAHSGYSSRQYDALAVVLATWMRRYRIPFEHITTHRHVDLGGERADPRSFDWSALQVRLAALGVLC
jgi:N-acetyl-anhydromuramyl-L-alanine amidase AmpD